MGTARLVVSISARTCFYPQNAVVTTSNEAQHVCPAYASLCALRDPPGTNLIHLAACGATQLLSM